MASSWRYGKRTKFRAKVSQDPEDFYSLDSKKSTTANAIDIYTELCYHDTRDTKRLYLLNALATLCEKQHQEQTHTSNGEGKDKTISKCHLGFTTEEWLLCLSASLVHTFTQVRAAALRTMRYMLVEPKDVKIFNNIQLPHLVCRSIDIMLKNDDERVQALKLVRKLMAIAPMDISTVLVRCLVSLADTGIEDKDNLLRACLATLCECAVLNPTLLIVCGGVSSITRNVLDSHNPRITESLCGVLLYLLEWPATRNISGVRLDCLAAPYCDSTYRLGIMEKHKDAARELRYTSCRLALLSVLRSWTGTIEFCDPSKPSALKAIVDALYLNHIEMRQAILDLLYELLGLPQPTCTDDYSAALQIVDPSDFQDAWLLTHGFVAAEGRAILPSLASRAPSIYTQHLALQLYCFLETGLLNALVEVIVSCNMDMSVRATVLIGKLLQLMHTHLPSDICSTSSALPTLIAQATKGNQNACAAITALQTYQKLLRNRPAACSLFLDSIIKGGSLIYSRLFCRDVNSLRSNLSGEQNSSQGGLANMHYNIAGTATLDRQRLDSVSSSDDSQSQSSSRRSSFRLKRKLLPFLENLRVNNLIKNSNVLSINDSNGWDWEVVITILRSSLIRKLDDTTGKFLKQLVTFFKPSKNRFSHQDLITGNAAPAYVIAGLDLIDWLLASNEIESLRLLTDFFSDVSQHLLAVTTNRAHDCLFSPQHMNNTMCQHYFLFIGRMCRVQKGIIILNNTAVFEHLINLVRNSDHVCYVKLIVSGMDYTLESVTRKVLERALTSAKTRSGRLYATQFLTVLLRAKIVNFEVWGIPLIIQQTKDIDRGVVLAALEVLEEACHEKYYLEEIVSLWPNLKGLGDAGRLVMVRFYSLSRGLNHSKARCKEEIEYWKQGYCKRYVLLVESDTHATFTLHVRNEDGYYSRRNCNTRPVIVPPNIPPHLYGQLVQTAQGTTALRKHGNIPQCIEVTNNGKCTDVKECLELKAALWAIGHTSTHSNGIEYLIETAPRIYEKIVSLATKCEVYSVRSTAFSVLGIIAGTNSGANILFKLDWMSVRHERNILWPVHQPEDWMSNNVTPARHHYEDMPPYNYSGIEDQIDGSFYSDSYWNLLLNSSNVNSKENVPNNLASAGVIGGELPVNSTAEATEDTTAVGRATKTNREILSHNAKSRTLPENTNMRYGRHQRSMSESKTTDMLSLNWNGSIAQGSAIPVSHHGHRIRYNSYTDSNTSGVSSCESVTGRAQITSEIQQFPLSPIPSLSNLLELPRKEATIFRRTSLLGNSFLQNTISPLDIKGYAQLRSLRRHCRPVLSESAADFYDIIDRSETTYASTRTHKSSCVEPVHQLKVRSLDRQASLRIFTQANVDELYQVSLPTATASSATKFFSNTDAKGPCYAGICLPKNLLELFPQRNMSNTYVLRDLQEQEILDLNLLTAKQQYMNDSINNEAGDESSVISSLSDVSSISKRSKWIGAKHGRTNCLFCSRTRRDRTRGEIEGNITTSGAACELYSNASAMLVAAGLQPNLGFPSKTNCKQTQKQAQQSQSSPHKQQQQQQQGVDISFNSPESIISEESMPDRLAANILYNVQRLANPVSAKQSKLALLEMKQKHPTSFQDICLYSEVCKTLGRSTYRMNARRFLQELFLDINMDAFYVEPVDILEKKKLNLNEVIKNENQVKKDVEKKSDINIQKSTTDMANVEHNEVNNANNNQQVNKVITSNNLCISGYKAVLNKLQPLESVYESSCENLLLEQHKVDGVPNCNGFTKSTTTTTTTINQQNITNAREKTLKPENLNTETITTIINKPNQKLTNKHVNDNKKYTRGRFYTLELDLSCTKNKFPITDRAKASMRRWTSGGDTSTTLEYSPNNPTKCESNNIALEENLNKSNDLKDAIISSTPTANNNDNKMTNINENNICNNSNSNLSSYKLATTMNNATSNYTITKSLAASFVKPIGSLYCEKRLLQSAKSEAVLSVPMDIVSVSNTDTTTNT